jgi:hypothetical protein
MRISDRAISVAIICEEPTQKISQNIVAARLAPCHMLDAAAHLAFFIESTVAISTRDTSTAEVGCMLAAAIQHHRVGRAFEIEEDEPRGFLFVSLLYRFDEARPSLVVNRLAAPAIR